MKKIILVVGIVAATSQMAWGGNVRDKLGIGFDVGGQKLYGDVRHSGVGPAFEGVLSYSIADRYRLTATLGYGQVNDGLFDHHFVTPMVNFDLRASYHIIPGERWTPLLYAGAGIFRFRLNSFVGGKGVPYGWFFDGSVFGGGGMEVMLNDHWALMAFLDYRFTTGDDLDFSAGNSKDGYLNGRTGLVYYLQAKPTVRKEKGVIAKAPIEEAKPEKREFPPEAEERFKAKIDTLEGARPEFTMEQYIRLKSRVDELSELIRRKEDEIQQLRSSLAQKQEQISELESKIQEIEARPKAIAGMERAPISVPRAEPPGYSATYDDGLRRFYARDYQGAIEVFEKLLTAYPGFKLASNCQYWVGESFYGLGAYEDAAQAFSKVLRYPKSPKIDDALLMLGQCYLRLDQTDNARQFLSRLIDEFPDSEYVPKANSLLKRLSAKTPGD